AWRDRGDDMNRTILVYAAKRAIIVAGAAAALAAWWHADGVAALAQQAAAAPTPVPVRMSRVFTGADGQTHAEEVELKFGGALGRNGLPNPNSPTPWVPLSTLQFRRTPPNYFVGWHPSATKHYVVTLSGRQDVEVSDGKKVRLYPGHILLVEDTSG